MEVLVILVVLAILLIPAIFFFLSLQKCLDRISEQNREMSPGLVWLNFIPLFNLGWIIYTVVKISNSVKNEGRSRNTTELGDGAYGVGLAMGICNIASIIPYLGFLTAIAAFVLWIIYWVQIAGINRKLEGAPSIGYRFCSQCGYRLTPSTSFCSQCGNSVFRTQSQETLSCPLCGVAVKPNQAYCARCGESLSRVT